MTAQQAAEIASQNMDALIASIPQHILDAIENASRQGMFEVYMDLDCRNESALKYLGYSVYRRITLHKDNLAPFIVSWPTPKPNDTDPKS